MSEIPMMENHHSTIFNFLSRFLHRFHLGDTLPSPIDYSNGRVIENPRLTGLDFDIHPGPINDAIHDAETLHKLLFVYVYCNDNPICSSMDGLFKSSAVARLITERYIFYPTSSTTRDGYTVAVGMSFTNLPLFQIFKPSGQTIADCPICGSQQGSIGEDVLIALLSTDRPDRVVDDPIREQQDREFLEAEMEDNRRMEEHLREALVDELDPERECVEKEFSELPELESSSHEVLICKFKFPDMSEKVRVFPSSGTTAMLYIFVRKFRFPEEFILRTGFPMLEIPDDETTIAELFHERSVVIYVADE